MTVIVHERAGADMIGERAPGGLAAEIVADLSAVEALWRSMEADPDCFGTPYQRFDWIASYLRATGTDGEARVAVLRDARGRPRMLLPLVLVREPGVVVARSAGDAHANYQFPLLAARDAAAIPAAALHAALARAGRAGGIDAFVLRHQPRVWDGAINPLAATGEPEASDAYGLILGPDPEATVRRVFSADARKKMRSKEKRLAEAHGPLAYRRAGTPEEARAFLAAFYVQKSARFAGMGIADPYAAEPIRRFLAAAASGADPAIELHALVLAETGRVLAVFGGAVDGARYSGMFTAFDPEFGRFSPGDLLLQHLVRDQAERGRRGFDLGVGEARYKASICDETIEMVETVLPVTLRGRAYRLVRVGLTRAKRRVKRNPRLRAAAERLGALRRR
ncbi:GNAT family N-acetyltransferase [Methylobacterium sp. NEAU 140]|uniref:GNAT family N-acetyltransferase n=1 Tax=Methylobacterium sp. NEAU 140 TaxID=3064945 RepID=UPI002732BC9B|nr:GNAT family N-acetyltransferase [Methylobacterium sp. NEAU 140]MDP4022519.1 GNAT family N-acetyltransferase [Methylobacterium sp. NEAU 140]